MGIQLKAVGTDISNIQIAGITQGGSNYGSVTNAQGQQVFYQNNLRTALSQDLPGQTFANTQALDAEIDKVNTFVNGTLPQLLTPVEKTSSSIIDQATAIQKTYGDAIEQSKAYGLDNTAVLQDAEEQALAIVRKSGVDQIHALSTQVSDRLLVAVNGSSASFQQAMDNFDISAQQQRESLKNLWASTYGDITLTSKDYLQAMVDLENTLGAERVAAAQQAAQAVWAQQVSLGGQATSLSARYSAATGDQETADMLNYTVQADNERVSYSKALLDFYGQSYANTQDYQNRMTQLEITQQAERLAIIKKYADQATEATAESLKTAQGNVTSLFGSLTDYAKQLQTGADSPLSPTAQYDLASKQLVAVFGAAAAGDFNSASQLSGYIGNFLDASRGVNGSGAQYAADYNQALDMLQAVTAASDALTASDMKTIMQDTETGIVDAISSLQDEVKRLRLEVQMNTMQQAQAA